VAKGYVADTPERVVRNENDYLRMVIATQHDALTIILDAIEGRGVPISGAQEVGRIAMRRAVAAMPELEETKKPAGSGDVEAILSRLDGCLAELAEAIGRPSFQATEDVERSAAAKALVASELHTRIMRLSWTQQADEAM